MIRIHKVDRVITSFGFSRNDIFFGSYSTEMCSFCPCHLHEVYVEIIERLKKNNLLEKNYELRCCTCHYLHKLK